MLSDHILSTISHMSFTVESEHTSKPSRSRDLIHIPHSPPAVPHNLIENDFHSWLKKYSCLFLTLFAKTVKFDHVIRDLETEFLR